MRYGLALSDNKTRGDSTEVKYRGKRGYRSVPDGETAAGAGAVSFLYSALA